MLFLRNNGCLKANFIEKCVKYASVSECSECDIDYYLKENQCVKITQPQNCRKLDPLN